ncbi:hypothetical protein JXJ21_12175 [candidate division KSB1 bacterium]|nr:hypothetical protein [candidate division KSB1 bacterium]
MKIIHQFQKDSRNFLILSDRNTENNPLVDISHESLIRQWGKLEEWVDKEAESVKIYQRLAETAEMHSEDSAGLYREADLQITLDWKKDMQPNAEWARRYHKGFKPVMAFFGKKLAKQ